MDAKAASTLYLAPSCRKSRPDIEHSVGVLRVQLFTISIDLLRESPHGAVGGE